MMQMLKAGGLPILTDEHRYRVIFTERPLNEILASQRVMRERSGKLSGRLAERQLAQTFLKQIAQVQRIRTPHGERVQMLSVPYHEALSDPAALSARLNAFLGDQFDETAMDQAVEPSLRRQGGGSQSAPEDAGQSRNKGPASNSGYEAPAS